MLDIKNYVGKVVRLTYSRNNQDLERVGVVWEQKNYIDSVEFAMLLTNGQDCRGTFRPENNLKVSSVRIDEGLRKALTDFCKVKIKQAEFLDKYRLEKLKHENNVNMAVQAVKEQSDELTTSECMAAIEELFQDCYPSTGGFHSQRYFDCRSGCPTSVTVSHCQEIEKYATPERYPFLYREYDGYLFVRHDCKEHDDFCRRNAPAVLPELKGFKTEVLATIGDKNFLEVERTYEIPLKYGLSKRSIEHIKELVFGIKPALSNVIATAEKQKGSNVSRDTNEKHIDGR